MSEIDKDRQYRPRLSEEEYRVVLAMKNGWKPDMSEIPQIDSEGERTSPAKILVFDIETAPSRGYIWSAWKQNIQPNQIISDWFMLTWAAKWLFEDDVMSARISVDEVEMEDDKRITEEVWRLLDKADIIIAHNAKKFDVPRLNTRFLLHGLPPPSPYQVIDTLETLRKRMAFTHNRLDYVNDKLGIGRKMDTGGFSLWDRCLKGEEEALMEMEQYNIQDVAILEETYLRIRPWIAPHPNIGLYIEDNVTVCPSCGSSHIEPAGTPYTTSVNQYESFRCKKCGSLGRSRKSIAAENKEISTNTASVAR
jgi:DNA polymerase elongation subunit (family B)